MKPFARQILTTGVLSLSGLAAINTAQAQIRADGTVSTEVTQSSNVFEITEGSKAGSNLFHSFQEFSLPTGNTAFFKNGVNITNIISRVTGGSISTIDGLIKANGGANLILINPEGISFGPNAQLNIGGSFLGSTADSVTFSDGTEFSATNPQNFLLTIAVPVGLQMGPDGGAIRAEGQGHNFTVADPVFAPINRRNNPRGLSVNAGNTLALVGNGINLEGGTLTAEGGRVELGSVAEGLVNLESLPQGWSLNYDSVSALGNLQLRSRALADTSGFSAGSIQLQGKDLAIDEGSLVLIQNQGFETAGNITLHGSDSITVSGTSQDGTFRTSVNNQSLIFGPAGDIDIKTEQLVVDGGASIVATTYGLGAGGDIDIKTSESIEIRGASPVTPVGVSSIASATFSTGDAGNTNVSTQRLTATGGGVITASTLGAGSGGNLNITATDSIDIFGVQPDSLLPSGLLVTSFSSGQAGNLTIDTSRFTVRDGGRIDASALASGDGGSLTINASEFVEVKGTGPESAINPSLITSAAIKVTASLQQAFNLPPLPSGKSGNITINTSQLKIDQGAQVTVRNDGLGDAGILEVNANSISLDNQGGISAASLLGEGGNINLQTNSLLMRHNSQISSTAGGPGNGGNITVAGTSPVEFVVLLEESAISANAFRGMGGNIDLETQALFVCPNCEITASSELGVDGLVELVWLQQNANLDVIDLPQDITKTEEIVALACSTTEGQEGSEFIVTGRGGLPPRPTDLLSSENLVNFDTNSSVSEMPAEEENQTQLPTPAQGWYVDSDGVLILTAQAPSAAPYGSGLKTPECHGN